MNFCLLKLRRYLFHCIIIAALPAQHGGASTKSYKIIDVEVIGAQRTSKKWLKTYIGFPFSEPLDDVDIEKIRLKLLTTQVFLWVRAQLQVQPPANDTYVLKIEFEEKWTTIPVVRGVYGGGTPVSIFGVYDTHSFGSLWTLGAETHKYGNEPIGGVVWARAPRFHKGYHSIGFEFWREFRLRTIYDQNDDKLGSIQSALAMFRLFFLAPTPLVIFDNNLKMGLDARVKEQSSTYFTTTDGEKIHDSMLHGIRLNNGKIKQTQTLLRTEYDNMVVDQLLYDGIRLILASGPQFETNNGAFLTEGEGFYYWQGWPGGNIAAHFFTGNTQSYALESQYFLGGLDSVRGLPDGVLYGRRAAYANLEARQILKRYPHLHIQSALFYDVGAAGENWPDATDRIRSSVGIGFRFAIPKIYRFLIRLDFAQSLEDRKTNGISLGVNELFQPYKPL